MTIDVLVPDARRRVPIGNVKADARGRFRFTYRFRRTLVAARYRFQARLVPSARLPVPGRDLAPRVGHGAAVALGGERTGGERAAQTAQKASTTTGSNCVPAQRRSSSSAACGVRAAA